MSESKEFSIEAILSITTGYLMSDSKVSHPMDNVYAILNFMTADNLSTLQLPRVARECEPYLKEWYPQLAEIDPSNWVWEAPSGVKAVDIPNFWVHELAKIKAEHGEYFTVWQIPVDDHDVIDVVQEVINMGFGDKLITIDLDDSEDDSLSPYGTLPPKS